jgi:SPP1 family predicted phage head-tail adaptor
MQAGRLRDRITILIPVSQRQPSGQIIETWTEGPSIWAEVKGVSGREKMMSGAESAIATVRLWVRFRRDITATSRIKVLSGAFRGAILNVVSPPIPDSGMVRLEILCRQGAEK